MIGRYSSCAAIVSGIDRTMGRRTSPDDYQKTWLAINGDELPPLLDVVALDVAVDMGIKQAISVIRTSMGLPAAQYFTRDVFEALLSVDVVASIDALQDARSATGSIGARRSALLDLAWRQSSLSPDDLQWLATIKRRSIIAAGTVVTVGDKTIPTWTDINTQAVLTALVVAVQQNNEMTIDWKGRDGNFYSIDATEIAAVATTVMSFVQEAFSVEAQVSNSIANGSTSSASQIYDFSWPDTGRSSDAGGA